MSDEQERPLTRRELREREGWVAQDAEPADVAVRAAFEAAAAQTGQTPVIEPEPEETAASSESAPETSSLSVVGPDGQPLSRRQLRELWLAEEAAAAAAAEAAAAPVQELVVEPVVQPVVESEAEVSAPVVEPEPVTPVLETVAEPVALPETVVEAAESVTASEQTVSVEPVTTVAEPAEAEQATDQPVEPQPVEAEPEIELDVAADADAEVVDEVETDQKPIAAPSQKGFRFPWKRDKKPAEEQAVNADEEAAIAATADEVAAAVLGIAAPAPEAPVETKQEPAAETTQPETVVVEPHPETSVAPPVEPVAQAVIEPEVVEPPVEVLEESQPEPEPEPEPEPYSFPEVTPDAQSRSIFDHQTTGVIGFTPTTEITDPNETGAFDDIITRAVADEGAASPMNTAALILPAMPDTTDLSGALNETGEIVITGSIELPRTLGETGGHANLHDTIDPHEAVVLGQEVHEIPLESENDTKPVAATRAVSAQAANNPIVSPTAKRDSKLPLYLAITAGGLFVGVVAVFIWAASTGLFG